jgi:hypothetical protein
MKKSVCVVVGVGPGNGANRSIVLASEGGHATLAGTTDAPRAHYSANSGLFGPTDLSLRGMRSLHDRNLRRSSSTLILR